MITLEGITKTYPLGKGNSVEAVRGVSLEIKPGEFIIIVGRSGSGKTTLLNLAAGLTRPTSGRITVDGKDLWGLTDREQSFLRNQKFGFVFQFPSLLPALSVVDNVVLPTVFRAEHSDESAYARAIQLLLKVGLDDKLEAYPRQLSAGQQQRVVIARAMMNQPELLFADEPTSNLDEKTELEIMELLRELHASLGIIIVLITHTRQLVSFGSRTLEMAEGRIVNAKTLYDIKPLLEVQEVQHVP